jgi:hypothetical protein
MSTEVKSWYWEAEHDKIAADEALRLVPSPEGWPGEGLECVGLWFLLMNAMWRSPRVGYLCDPVDEKMPISTTSLAKLLGRDEQVVCRVMTVLLAHNFFSKNDQGIIFSRGILRKLELRKKRSKAGKKGGLRTGSLLKQNAKQKPKQTLGIDIGIQGQEELKPSQGGEISPKEPDLETLAAQAALKSGRDTPKWRTDWLTHLQDLVDAGFTIEALSAEINAKKRTETPWEFAKRLTGATNGPGKQSGDENPYRFQPGKDYGGENANPG